MVNATSIDTYVKQLEDELRVLKAQSATPPPAPPPVAPPAVQSPPPLKLDLGCGKNKREGFLGVDTIAFPGVDIVADMANAPWPWADGSVEEVNCSHMLEHVTQDKRVHFMNELWRVLKSKGTATIITPHWGSQRAYGDVTHQWPPVVPMFYAYLDAEWRKGNAPHTGFTCDFTHSAMIRSADNDPDLTGRNPKYLEHAVRRWLDVGADLHCVITKRGG